MRLIEKLAEESLKTYPEEGKDIDEFATCYELGFEAGFRKAREMAAAIEPCFYPNRILHAAEFKSANSAISAYRDDIKALGESEAE